MRLTIVPSDKSVIVNGAGANLDQLTAPVNVHALQWYETKGDIELTDNSSQKITELPTWAINAVNDYNILLATFETDNTAQLEGQAHILTTISDYPKAIRKSVDEIIRKDYQNIQLQPYVRDTDNNIIGLYSDYMVGAEGVASFREVMKLARKLGVPVFSNPYPRDDSTYESFKSFLQAEGMVVYDNGAVRFCYTPWTLDFAKARKNVEISNDIDLFLAQNPFEHDGLEYDTDERSRMVIAQKATQIIVDGSTTDIIWRLADNTNAVISTSVFLEMASALTSHVENQYGISWFRKAQVEAATTIAELDAI